VQVLIYEVDLAYQPDGRLAVDANADEACDIPDGSHARVADGGIQPAQCYTKYLRISCTYLDLLYRFGSRIAGNNSHTPTVPRQAPVTSLSLLPIVAP